MIRRRPSYLGGLYNGDGGVEEKKEDDSIRTSITNTSVQYVTTTATPTGAAPISSAYYPQQPAPAYPYPTSYYASSGNNNIPPPPYGVPKFNRTDHDDDDEDDEQQYHDRNDYPFEPSPVNPADDPKQRSGRDEVREGIQAQVEHLANVLFGSCSFLLSNTCPGVMGNRPGNAAAPGSRYYCTTQNVEDWVYRCESPSKAPLSIAEELRQLAEKEGRVFHSTGGPTHHMKPRTAKVTTQEQPMMMQTANGYYTMNAATTDIPRYLGEQAVYSFEDDTISAISQNTLEEMARHGLRYPIVRRIPTEDVSMISGISSTNQSVVTNTTTTSGTSNGVEDILDGGDNMKNHPYFNPTSYDGTTTTKQQQQQQHAGRKHTKKKKKKSMSTKQSSMKQHSWDGVRNHIPPPVPESYLEDLTLMSSKSPL